MNWIFTVVLAGCGVVLGAAIHRHDWVPFLFAIPYGIGGALLGFMIDTSMAISRLARIQKQLVTSNNLLVQRLEELADGQPVPAALAPEQPLAPRPDEAPCDPDVRLQDAPPDAVFLEDVPDFLAEPLPSALPPALLDEPNPEGSWSPKSPPSDVRNDWAAKTFEVAKVWLLGGNTILRVGMVLLFLGLGFFLRYAALHLDISTELRYAGVGVFALILLVLGWGLRNRNPNYALALQGLGVAALYLTTFSALRIHSLITPEMAFGLLVVLTVASTALAVLQNAMAMAVVTALGGFAAPILTSTGKGDYVVLFSYYALLNTGIFAVAWFKAWRLLNLVGFFATFGIGTLWGIMSYHPDMVWPVEGFVLLFFLMYLAIGILFASRRLKETPIPSHPGDTRPKTLINWGKDQGNLIDGTLLFGPPLIGFTLQWGVVHHIPYATALSALVMGALYIGLAVVFRRFWRHIPVLLLETCLALGVILATLAVPLALDADWTSAIWAVQGAGLYWLGLRQNRPFARLFALALQGFALVSCLISLSPGTETSLIDGNPMGALMLAGAFLWTFWTLRQAPPETLMAFEPGLRPLLGGLGIAALALAPALLWTAQACALAWALIGVATVFAAIRLKDPALFFCGLTLQGVAALACLSAATTTASPQVLPLLNVGFLSAAALSLAGFFSGWGLHRAPPQETRALGLDDLGPKTISAALVVWGVLWAGWAVNIESLRFVDPAFHAHSVVLVATGLSAIWIGLGLRLNWGALCGAALNLPAVGLLMIGWNWFAGFDSSFYSSTYQPLAHGGWLIWPVAIGVTLTALFWSETRLPKGLVMVSHGLTAWLIVGVGALTLREALMTLSASHNAWRWLGWSMAPTFYLLAVSCLPPKRWPLSRHARTYGVTAAAPVFVLLLVWFWSAALLSDGAADPLPYLPLFNPLELGLALAFGAGLTWIRYTRHTFGLLVKYPQRRWVGAVAVASVFLGVTWGVFRAAHQWTDLPFDLEDLLASQSVQAALSIVWTLMALTFMIAGHVRKRRAPWVIGASLMGAVTLKLFFVELSTSDGIERAISFLGVGLLMLIVGYFAPLPPRHQTVNKELAPS